MPRRLITRLPGIAPQTHDAVRLTNDRRLALQEGLDDFDGEVTRVRPAKSGPGLEYGQELIGAFHRKEVSHSSIRQWLGLGDPPAPTTFELWFHNDRLQVVFTTPTEQRRELLYGELNGLYPNAEVEPHDRLLPHLDEELYVAGGRALLKEAKYFPLRGVEGAHDFETTPHQELTNALVGGSEERTMLQVSFVSADENWLDGRFGELSYQQVARDKRWGRIDNPFLRRPKRLDPSEKDKRMAEAALGEHGAPAFHVNIRFLAFAPSPARARQRASSIGAKLTTTYHNEAIDQAFSSRPYTAHAMDDMLYAVALRDWWYQGVTLDKKELGAIVHLPNENAECQKLDYSRDDFGADVPSTLPRKSKSVGTIDPTSDAGQETDRAAVVDRQTTVPPTPATPDDLTLAEAVEKSESFGEDDVVATAPTNDDGSVLRQLVSGMFTSSSTDESPTNDPYEVVQDIVESDEFERAALAYAAGDLTRRQLVARYNEAVADRLVERIEAWLETEGPLAEAETEAEAAGGAPASETAAGPAEAAPADEAAATAAGADGAAAESASPASGADPASPTPDDAAAPPGDEAEAAGESSTTSSETSPQESVDAAAADRSADSGGDDESAGSAQTAGPSDDAASSGDPDASSDVPTMDEAFPAEDSDATAASSAASAGGGDSQGSEQDVQVSFDAFVSETEEDS